LKATVDLAFGQTVSLQATIRTTPAGLVCVALVAAAVLLPTASLAKALLSERRASDRP
jgi:hypothetical protein